MTDETDFRDHLVSKLSNIDGVTVSESVYLDDIDRYLDIFVQTNSLYFAIEVEDTRADALYNGVGQASLYAHTLDAVPVVVYPAEDGMTPELRMQSSTATVVPVPTDWNGSLTALV